MTDDSGSQPVGGIPSYAHLRVQQDAGPDDAPGAVWVVTIDRARSMNAIDVATMRELADVFAVCETAAKATPALRAVVLTGAGDRAFVAGADIGALSGMSSEEAHAFSELGHRVGARIESLPIPVIAAVNGYALGGGCELALACDFIYAAETARFGLPEARLGAIPGFGGTQRLMRRVGIARARELLFTGETIDAVEAVRIGLCNRAIEPTRLMAEARHTAATIAARAPLAIASLKRAVVMGADRLLAEALRTEAELFAALFSTQDLATGMRAFLDKDQHPPKWQAR